MVERYTKFLVYGLLILLLFAPHATKAEDLFIPSTIPKSLSSVLQSDGAMDTVIASVEGDPITLSDLRAFAATQRSIRQEGGSGLADFRVVLRDAITANLLDREAKSSGISVSDEEVAAYVDEIKKQNGLDESAFAELLRSKGLSEEAYKSQVRSDILKTRVLGTKVRGRVAVSAEDVTRYLKDHPERQRAAGGTHVEQLLFAPAGGEPRSVTEVRAKQALEKLHDGAKMSEELGGEFVDLGFMRVEELRPDLAKVAAHPDKQGFVGPVAVQEGFIVLHVKEEAAAADENDPVREEVKKELMEEKFNQELEKFLKEDLRKKYVVEYAFVELEPHER